MKRVLLDTNLLVSALLFGGIPRQVYDAGIHRRYILISTNDLVAELTRVLAYPKLSPRFQRIGGTPDTLIAVYLANIETVQPGSVPEGIVRDADDRAVLACAVGGKADTIVSGDNDLLTLGSYQNIPILSAVRFLNGLSSIKTDDPTSER